MTQNVGCREPIFALRHKYVLVRRCCACTALAAIVWASCHGFAVAAELPPRAPTAPVPTPHFPDTCHAVVWRNWTLVEPALLADVLGTTSANVVALADAMGLPTDVAVEPEFRQRGYITLVRRNWHLLPYEQLQQLLGISAEELAFRLREDDFLAIKLGSAKPPCAPVRYQKPDAGAQRRTAEIAAVVRAQFGDVRRPAAEPRFAFAEAWARDEAPVAEVPRRSADEPPRFIYSYCATFGDPLANPQWDPFPDGLLAQLRARGVNGVWLHTVLRQLAPGGEHFPEFGEGWPERLANLRRLVERARRHGIDVYLYVNEPRSMPHAFFTERPELAGVREGAYTTMCTSDPRVRQWLADALAHVFAEVPHLGGVFAITASENLTNCASHGQRAACPRCAARTNPEVVAEVVAAIEEGVHRSAPDARVIAWDWGWGDAWGSPDEAVATIERLPPRTWLMSVSEWSLPIERGGIASTVGEYSMSAVGPGPRATRHWAAARQRGLATMAKVQFNVTWELASVPTLPVLDLVAEHCAGLAEAGTRGLMLSWTLGGQPSANLELAAEFAAEPELEVGEALDRLALRQFGAAGAPHARQAWTAFSEAFREYPYCGALIYNGPQHMGPANLLHARSTGYRASMVGLPHDDLAGWRGPYPAETLASQFTKVAQRWAEGLEHLETAVELAPAEVQGERSAELRVARAAYLHWASVANQVRFVMAREAAGDRGEAAEATRRMLGELLEREIALARDLYDLATVDSRLGYEASNHYFYVPLDLVEKAVSCAYLQQEWLEGRD